MGRYLKLGGMSIAILAIGFLLGSGSIGDIIQSWVSGTGASADQAAVEENRQQLADRDVAAIGEALGSENPRMGYDLAVRCIALTKLIPVEMAERDGLSLDDLLTIRANGTTVAINQSEDGAFQVSSDVARQMPPGNFDVFNPGSASNSEPTISDMKARQYMIELKNGCSPLQGRAAKQQNRE